MNYGMPYMGSKSKIADKIIHMLPSGKRLVDMFGGGAAISHAAGIYKKWNTVLYNELNPFVCEVLQDAMDGKYSYDVFKPEFITREEFEAKKNTCGYVKYIWSFGNNGRSYLFGKDIENYKRILHNAVVFDDFIEMNLIYPELKQFPENCITIKDKRLFIGALAKVKHNDNRNFMQLEQLQQLQRLEQLERLQQLQRLEQLERLQRFEISNKSYLDVELHDGDVIYCDPPYAGTAKYSKDGFNHAEFWQWVRDCPHCVIVSEYSAPDDIVNIGSMDKIGLMNGGTAPRKIMIENLYWNGKGDLMMGTLF